MLEIGIALGLTALFSGSALLGFAVKDRVPEAHRSKEAMQLVQLVMSLLVTFTALVLGLLTTSVKSSYTGPSTTASGSRRRSPSSTAACAISDPVRNRSARSFEATRQP